MTNIPKKIFIVPYRSRPEQKFFFCKYMKFLLEYMNDYEIYFSHQTDKRSFNRGATRNIGFLAMKEKYPNHYRDITFIFNDLDTLPFNRIFDYETIPGIVNHYYGFTHSLGGIVVIKGSDFEKINGYPNYWSWGLEDTCLQKRCEKEKLTICRKNFHKIGSPQILQLFDGVDRIINKKDPHKLKDEDGSTGLSTIHKLKYEIQKKSTEDIDNIYESLGENFYYINISSFHTETRFEDDEYYKYDLREPISKITNPDPTKRTNRVDIKPTEWSNITYYPTAQERKEASQVTQIPPNVAMPTHPLRNFVPNMMTGNRRQVPQNTLIAQPPRTFKDLKKQNTQMFPPKTISNAGGTSAINKINLRYRMAKT